MPNIFSISGAYPKWGKKTWVAPNATLVGDVVLGANCSVWFQTVIRGDVNRIRIGDYVNIQDGAILHCTYKEAELAIGNNVSIGHGAIVHGCHIEDDVLIGMGAIVMDHAHIPSNVIIGAGAIVPENKKLESGYIYVGQPARPLRKIEEEDAQKLIRRTAENYTKYASWYGDMP
jgi:carbonic anhydrase/acetyltransferase-like protein (isoleucine patch superfamily)